MNVTTGLLAIGLCGVLSACVVQQETATPTEHRPPALEPAPLEEEWAVEWWLPRHREKLALARERDPELVFLGDSITQGWEGSGEEAFEDAFGQWRTLNLGFSGDRTENVLWRLEHGAVSEIAPELIVMMIGTNNTGHRMDPPEEIAAGVTEIVEQLQRRLPESKILLLAIFPRSASPDDPMRLNNEAVNAQIRGLARRDRVFWMNLNDIFLDDRGQLPKAVMPDLLHPEEKGYRLLAEALKPVVDDLMSQH